MATDRRADVTWNGSLMDGSGTIRSTTSGAAPSAPCATPQAPISVSPRKPAKRQPDGSFQRRPVRTSRSVLPA